jgi:hypothetical protein
MYDLPNLPLYLCFMTRYNAPFEIHVHGQVALLPSVKFEQIEEALKPLWKYAGAKSLSDGAGSSYEEEPGIKFEPTEHLLQMCWTVPGDEDFRQSLDEMCMNLNELVGPTPAAIMQVQRDLLVQDVVNLMERHFDGSELAGVVAEVDKLFTERFDALVNSLELGKPPRGFGGGSGGSGHGGGGRRPRHLH